MLYLITSGPAATRVRQYDYRTSVGGLGNGWQTWNALYAKYHNNSKEAEGANYEKLVKFRMEERQVLDDYTFKLLDYRGRLHKTGHDISGERCKDIGLQRLARYIMSRFMKPPSIIK